MMSVRNSGAKIHCTPVNHLFQTIGEIPSSELGKGVIGSSPRSRTGSLKSIVAVGELGNFISPSASDVSTSTTGNVIVKQKTAGIARTATTF